MTFLSQQKHSFLAGRLKKTAMLALFALSSFIGLPKTVQADDHAGLVGILPSNLPREINEASFEVLPEGWKDWSQKSIGLLKKVYSDKSLSLAEQKETLGKISGQLAVLDKAASTPGTTGDVDSLISVSGKLNRRLAVLQAILITLDQNTTHEESLRPALKKMIAAIEDHESDSILQNENKFDLTSPDATVRQQLAIIDTVTSGNINSLQEAIRLHYFNFNIRTFISEPFAESVFHECRRECGPVCDFILGARVRGNQRTDSGVSINFLPSNQGARFAIQVNGNTTSNTRGVTNQATVYTYGRHRFSGKKILEFDGDIFSSHNATLSVWANNRVTGAHLNHRGLLAKIIGDRIAYEKAVEKKPQTEAVAAQRLRSKVLPKFNREIDDTFGDLNTELKALEKRMKLESIAPDEKMVRTDTDELRTAYRLMSEDQLAADRPANIYNSKTGITLHIHESWINNAFAVESYNFAQPEISFPAFSKTLAEKFKRAFNTKKELKTGKDSGDKLLLSEVDPFHVQFEDGKVKVIMRVGLRRAGRDDIIKLRRIEVPVQFEIQQESIQIKLSETSAILVNPLDSSDLRPIYNRIMGKKIGDQFKERFEEDGSLDRIFDLPVNEKGDKKVPVIIDSIHSANGWLTVVLEQVK